MSEEVYINFPAKSFNDLAELFRQLGEAFPDARNIQLENMIPSVSTGGEVGIRAIWVKEVSR
jgi:hypothetical protein